MKNVQGLRSSAARAVPLSRLRREVLMCERYIVVPCYNEEVLLPEAVRQFDALVCRLIAAGKISPGSRVAFVGGEP